MTMKTVQELLDTGLGTEGQLLIPRKILDVLIGETEKKLIPRSEAAIMIGPSGIPGSSLDVDFETEDTLDVRLVGEGAEYILDNAAYTSSNFKPLKYGVAIRITRELIEDSKFELLARNVRLAGKRFAENENSLVITALDSAANTVAGGASLTVGNITRAIQHLSDADMDATTFAVGNEVMNDLQNISLFTQVNESGSDEMLRTATKGIIYGMKVVQVSTNAGMTSTSSYVFDNSEAYIIVEKRPITVEGFKLETFDMEGAVVSQRIAVGILKTIAVAKITTS